jgi:3-hydroxybutyrate dehydrogenase
VVVNNYSSQSNTPNRAVFQKTDVVDWEQLEGMFEVAVREFGDVDIVCPGAGIYEPVRRARLLLPDADKFSGS